MLKKWPKFEKKINALLLRLFALIRGLFLKAIPTKVKTVFINFQIKISNKKNLAISGSGKFATQFKAKILKFVKQTKLALLDKVRFILIFLDDLKKIRVKDISPKKFIINKAHLIKSLVQKVTTFIKAKIDHYGAKNVFALAVLFVVATVSITQIYLKSRKIFIGSGIIRGPASVQAAPAYKNPRPDYYKDDEKQLIVRSIDFPVYIESITATKSLSVEITITTDNKYTRAYLFDNLHLVNDILNTKLEPVIPSFPLETEGKTILKDKIKKELNELLKSKKIKGEINSVQVHSMVAG